MSKITNFEELDCWKSARKLTNIIFDICENPKLKYQFRLKEQLSSASISVMNNIAEGFGRFSRLEFIRFLNIAAGSCAEVGSMSYILLDRNVISNEEFQEIQNILGTTRSKTNGLIKYLKANK